MHVLERVTFVQGGFAPVGGIESFATDLLSAVSARQIRAELICWDAAAADNNPALASLSKSDVAIYSSKWRWGCQWGWPDKWMATCFWQRMMAAEVLVFGKLLHDSILRRLAKAKKRMILITPYRPAEMWKDRPPDHEILNSLETIVVQAHAFEKDLRALRYGGRIVTLPYLPPEAQRPAEWPTASTLQIGFLGRLVPDKNLEYLIRSISCLRESDVAAQLHLFGEGPERASLQSLVDKLGLVNHIKFHGQLDREQVSEAIDGCHLFAFGSRTEGQCLAALEILARGRPVLATPVGAFPEILSGPLGSIAPLGCPTTFASALKILAEPIVKGEITPADVQRAYKSRFPRCQIIGEYMRLFGGTIQQE
jgi:glycosyltransferase involved in cell wall biosynthesis